MASTIWTANRRLYLAADGVTVVEADDERRATLLVPAGGTLPLDRARQLGLLNVQTTETIDALGAALGDPAATGDTSQMARIAELEAENADLRAQLETAQTANPKKREPANKSKTAPAEDKSGGSSDQQPASDEEK